MAIESCDISSKSEFPERFRLLVVHNDNGDDTLCLKTFQKVLIKCLYEYEVTKCNSTDIALEYLHDKKNCFDMVLTDVRMPGYKLVENVALKMGLSVFIMSSVDSDEDVVFMKEEEELEVMNPKPRRRFVWSFDLRQQFLNALNQIPHYEAYPKRIQKVMNVPGLTREIIACHLQKYKLYVRANSKRLNQNEINSPDIGSSNTNIKRNHIIERMKLLHRSNPTTVDPNQLASLNQSNVSRQPLLNEDSAEDLAQVVSDKLMTYHL